MKNGKTFVSIAMIRKGEDDTNGPRDAQSRIFPFHLLLRQCGGNNDGRLLEYKETKRRGELIP